MGGFECCDGVDLECFGCNPDLLEQGLECKDQPTSPVSTVPNPEVKTRDCFCDFSCIMFEDCCDDHAETCIHLYTTTTSSTTTTTTTSTTTTTTNDSNEPISTNSAVSTTSS